MIVAKRFKIHTGRFCSWFYREGKLRLGMTLYVLAGLAPFFVAFFRPPG